MRRHRGAALLMAMLTVALVATLAAGALWQQWKSVEIEASERSRVQAGWILAGALDWARLILREDARSGGPDHLAEPWSVGLAEARLSTFLSMDRSQTDDEDNVFLSGQITDAQARMNVMNLVVANKASEPDVLAFTRLFEELGLDPSELEQMTAKLLLALDAGTPTDNAAVPLVPLLPRRVEQLRWLGLSAESLRLLTPFITLLPTRTTVNLNTAPAEVLAASVPALDMGGAEQLLAARKATPFRSLAAAGRVISQTAQPLDSTRFGIASRYFEVRGRLRLEHAIVEERSLVVRDGLNVATVWRERAAIDPDSVARMPTPTR